MSNLKFQLNANKHPKDCPSNSLVYAHNIRVSDDFSCLQNEESIIGHPTINAYIEEFAYNIVSVIPCNKELVIFVTNSERPGKASILRYNENDDIIVHMYSNLEYSDGKIIGTFTYNINNELIIAFSEYGGNEDVPLKTINLGVWNGENTTSEELNFYDGKLALSPEVKIPSISSFDYVPGNSYKGWYYYFIRYKINKNDYTRWFPIGFPIFITNLDIKNIFKYGLNNGLRDNNIILDSFILNGVSDYISSKEDTTDESVLINISNLDKNYKCFQIGFCCISKTYTKAFRTADINTPSSVYVSSFEYITNISNCIEYNVNDLILNTYNYYNVGNVINYKNRLYISNYKESNQPTITKEELGNIRLRLIPESVEYSDIKYKDLWTDIESDTDLQTDSVPANPILYFETPYSSSITLRDNEEIAHNLENFDHCFILTTNQNKIRPTASATDESGGQIKIVLAFKIGYDFYSCTLRSYIASGGGGNRMIKVVDASNFNSEIIAALRFQYINTNNSFKDRKIQSTLLPGEVYNFYIHFINKYGEPTVGYKIPNTVKFKITDSNVEYFPIRIDDDKFLLVNVNQRIFADNDHRNIIINPNTNKIANRNFMSYDSSSNTYTFSNVTYNFDTIRTAMTNLLVDYNIYKIKNNITWNDLFSTILYDIENETTFSYHTNTNGNSLFKVPDSKFSYDSSSNTIKTTIFNLKFDLTNFTLPEGYIGYYFSYEKFEKQNKVDGILTKFDVFNQDSIGTQYKKYNNENEDTLDYVNFYSSQLDIADNLDLDYNLLRISNTAVLNHSNSTQSYNVDKIDLSTKYPINYNNVEFPENLQIDGSDYTINPHVYCLIDNFEYKKGGTITDGKFGIGTSLNIKLASDEYTKVINRIFDNVDFIKASIIKINKNIYTNENKILIKFTDIYYTPTKSGIINKGLNGHITYQGTLIYNYNKFIMSAENAILTEQFKTYYRCPVYQGLYENKLDEDRPPIAYIQQICFNDNFYEAKSFKTEPETLFFNLEQIKDNVEQVMPFAANSIVTPANSVDLFEELQTNQDKLNPKTYLAKNDNRTYLTQFDKRVRRSNVIADESLNNSWRTFPLEGYKDISENKGNITNLVGIGTTLLVHTEHSLFAFDGSNTLKTGDDQNIRLTLPDIFDIDYTEVFTSDLGVCGLQDKEAWIVGQFGYIFYDNDAHRFYKFAFKKIEVIDYDIVQLLNNSIPYEVRFASDVERNRLLIKFKIYDGVYREEPRYVTYTISYNHQLNKFISWHTYSFDKATNTKSMLYLIYNNKIYCNIHDLNWSDYKIQRRRFAPATNNNYGTYENGTNTSPKLSIIVNDSYNIIKTIEFISYKLFKKSNSSADSPIISNIVDERELTRIPYSGYQIHIHNDMCDSGLIDVSIDTNSAKNVFNNYKKPWWEFGNWNFNYFRDTKQGVSSHDIMSRLYGNYFIIDFIFYDDNNPYNQKIEFENLDVKLIADETV